jgi:hypothetical protein
VRGSRRGDGAWIAALVAAAALFAFLLFGGLSRPLMWNDEAYTAMYAERVLEHGVPRVDDGRNVVYGLDAPLEVGTKETGDYIGSPWGEYYVAAPGALLARATRDPYAKTLRLRLPFAILGCAGVACFLWAALPLLPGRRARTGLAAAYLVACATSISLVLHLREVRYYALVVLFGGLAVLAFRQREITRRPGPLPAALLALALLGLFSCFYPAFGVLAACLGLHALARAIRPGGSPAARARGFAGRIAPVAVATALVLPAAVYLEVPRVLAALRGGIEPTLPAWLDNLAIATRNLLRLELLAPVLAVKLVLIAARRADPQGLRGDGMAARRELSGFLTLVLVAYLLAVSRAPFVFERYFVLLSPLLATLLLLDASLAIDLLRASASGRRSLQVRMLAVASLACLAGSLAVRAPDVSGRIREIATPVVGPLDVVIPYLLARHPHTEELVIATNYEDPAYVYYLGSRVIVRFNATALARDLEETPDVVIPRRPRHRAALLRFLENADYERLGFPVYNTVTNQVPSLSPWTPGLDVHRFATRLPRRPAQEVVIFERKRPQAARSEPEANEADP